MKKAIIIGASSGIGAALAKAFSAKGYSVGITARRLELLEELAGKLPGEAHVKRMDIANHGEAVDGLRELVSEMGSMDALVLNAAIGGKAEDEKFDWEFEVRRVSVNVMGFVALAAEGFNYFFEQGSGSLAGISSVAMLRGNRFNPEYSASKAFVSTYLEGMRLRARKAGSGMKVVDIRPGFIDAPLNGSKDFMLWVADVDKSAAQMVRHIEKGTRVAYVPSAWRGTELPFRFAPSFLYEKI